MDENEIRRRIARKMAAEAARPSKMQEPPPFFRAHYKLILLMLVVGIGAGAIFAFSWGGDDPTPARLKKEEAADGTGRGDSRVGGVHSPGKVKPYVSGSTHVNFRKRTDDSDPLKPGRAEDPNDRNPGTGY